MLRALLLLALTATPVLAWEFSPRDVCELRHKEAAADVLITYDPGAREYAIAVTLNRPWLPGSVFSIRFDGPRGMKISTERHRISEGGKTLTVKDRGFGNVLNGIEFNGTATALLGEQAVTVTLDGAGPAVRAFRACADGVGV